MNQEPIIKKKAKLPKHLFVSEMTETNQKYVDEYIALLENANKEKTTIEGYTLAYNRIFKFKPNSSIEFYDYTTKIIDDFSITLLEYDISEDRLNYFISAIRNLAEYCKKTYSDKFDRFFLGNLQSLTFNEKKRMPSRALTPIELSLVKEFIKHSNDRKLEYIFTVLYYTDTQKKEFDIYNPRNADYNEKCFKNKDRKVPFTKEIEKALEYVKDENITSWQILDHLNLIAEYLHKEGYFEIGKNFTGDDIKLTKSKYFVSCPCCNRLTENIAENWVVVDYNGSEQKFIVCNKCKGVVQSE